MDWNAIEEFMRVKIIVEAKDNWQLGDLLQEVVEEIEMGVTHRVETGNELAWYTFKIEEDEL
jgi:hypothetical protein